MTGSCSKTVSRRAAFASALSTRMVWSPIMIMSPGFKVLAPPMRSPFTFVRCAAEVADGPAAACIRISRGRERPPERSARRCRFRGRCLCQAAADRATIRFLAVQEDYPHSCSVSSRGASAPACVMISLCVVRELREGLRIYLRAEIDASRPRVRFLYGAGQFDHRPGVKAMYRKRQGFNSRSARRTLFSASMKSTSCWSP
jgi:hypothetical protein